MTKKRQKILNKRGCDVAHQFTNLLMINGKKENAHKVVLSSIMHSKAMQIDGSTQDSIKRKRNAVQTNFHSYTKQPHIAQARDALKKQHFNSNQICAQTISNVEPVVETRRVRIRGNTHQVPAITTPRQKRRVALHWIIEHAKKKQSKRSTFPFFLGEELLNSLKQQSSSIQKRDQLYKLAVHNRAYARYRWW